MGIFLKCLGGVVCLLFTVVVLIGLGDYFLILRGWKRLIILVRSVLGFVIEVRVVYIGGNVGVGTRCFIGAKVWTVL